MTRTFFRYVWRFNALAIASVSVAALMIAALAGVHLARGLLGWPHALALSDRRTPASDVDPRKATAAPPDTALRTETFQPIRGMPLAVAAITAEGRWSRDASSYRSSSDAFETRNYVFYDRAAGASRLLFPDHRQVIVEFHELRADDGEAPPRAYLLAFVANDGNGDGRLDVADPKTIALARPDGVGVTPIAEAAQWTRGAFVEPDGAQAVVMIDDGSSVDAVHVDLGAFEVRKRHRVAR